MRVFSVVLTTLVTLSACAVPQTTAPVTVRSVVLYRDTVTAQMSDGSLCVGQRPGGAQVWGGVMTGCPHLVNFQVTQPANAARAVLVQGQGQKVIVDGQGYGPA